MNRFTRKVIVTTLYLAGAIAGVVAGVMAYAETAGTSPLSVKTYRSDEPITPITLSTVDPTQAALGEALFHDPRLSRGSTRACAACHDTSSNGADARAKDVSIDGKPVPKNTNTVFNAALSFRFDWVGDAATLEQQADMALMSPNFMGSTWPDVLAKLRSDKVLTARFRNVYGQDPDRSNILDAIADYERTLVTPNSRFDLWLRGDDNALSPAELEGYGLFKSVGCASCHQGVNVGGNLFEKTGIFRPLLSGSPEMMRVPSLRNVAVTSPYFHDASARTLEEAVRRMARAQLGRDLTPDHIHGITLFLETLTGRYRGTMLTAPR